MAEGFARQLKSDHFVVYSAGIETHGLNPTAVKVMAEVAVDITGHESTHVDDLQHIAFDWVVTVCDHAAEQCPIFPGQALVVHRAFDDPPRLARDAKNEQETLRFYRRVRDEIRAYVETLPEGFKVGGP